MSNNFEKVIFSVSKSEQKSREEYGLLEVSIKIERNGQKEGHSFEMELQKTAVEWQITVQNLYTHGPVHIKVMASCTSGEISYEWNTTAIMEPMTQGRLQFITKADSIIASNIDHEKIHSSSAVLNRQPLTAPTYHLFLDAGAQTEGGENNSNAAVAQYITMEAKSGSFTEFQSFKFRIWNDSKINVKSMFKNLSNERLNVQLKAQCTGHPTHKMELVEDKLYSTRIFHDIQSKKSSLRHSGKILILIIYSKSIYSLYSK